MSLLKLITLTERFFRLLTSVGRRKNSEFPREPQTSDLRIPRSDSLSYSNYKHESNDIADPCSMQDACHTNFIKELARHRVSVSQW